MILDPADREHPIGLNLLAHVEPDRRHLVASAITDAFKSIWRDSWGPRMEYILYAAIAALLDCQNTSILGLQRMLEDERYRRWVIRQIKDPAILRYWTEEFASYDQRFRREAIAPIQNKVGQLIMAPPIRNVFGQVRSTIDLRFMMDDRRILLANLSKGRIGADKANLFGALLVSQLQTAAMSRSNLPPSERVPFHLYIDEYHNFTTDAFNAILSEARKYGLRLTLANQYLAQVPQATTDAVLGNVGSVVVFRVSDADAQVMSRELEKYGPSTLTGLRNHEVAARLLRGRKEADPLIGRTYPPLTTDCGAAGRFSKVSRQKYGVTRCNVERRIEAWLQRQF